MRELPILFSASMVRAILEGRKTVTRRMVKPQPDFVADNVPARFTTDDMRLGRLGEAIRCPYGQPGDRLWVRETFFQMPHPANCGLTREAIPHSWDSACADAGRLIYRADRGAEIAIDGMRWKPSIHMPRWASRITLEVTGVHVGRLQDGEGEMDRESRYLAEGINRIHHGDGAYYYSAIRDEPNPKNWCDPFDAWRELWVSVNGIESWNANPWVWGVEFKRVPLSTPEDC